MRGEKLTRCRAWAVRARWLAVVNLGFGDSPTARPASALAAQLARWAWFAVRVPARAGARPTGPRSWVRRTAGRSALSVASGRCCWCANLVLGSLVWAFHLTDYGLAGAVADLWFPLCVGLVGIVSLRSAARLRSPLARALVRSGAVVTLSGGGFYVVALPLAVAGIVLLPWAFYRLANGLEEMAAETVVQDVASPSGAWRALVYFQPVGDNAGDNGHVSLRVAHAGLLQLERRIYYVPVSRVATAEPAPYVRWMDEDTLYVAETNELVSVAPQRSRRPAFVAVPLGWLMQIRESLDPSLTASLREVPRFPGGSVNEGAGHNSQADTFQHWYAIPGQHPESGGRSGTGWPSIAPPGRWSTAS